MATCPGTRSAACGCSARAVSTRCSRRSPAASGWCTGSCRTSSRSGSDAPFAELTDDQQRVLREVLRSGHVVDWQLRNLGLPDTPEALDAYIRGVEPGRRWFWPRG